MAIYTNLPVFKATYQLLLDVSQMSPHLPRDCRYTLGQELRSRLMEIMVLIYRANSTRQKGSLISQMRQTVVEVQVYLRLMSDMRYISERKYAQLAELSVGVSRQMAAWEKSVSAKKDNGDEHMPAMQAKARISQATVCNSVPK